ncbi:hypothetical protein J2S21_001208 [Peribacillus cavernae]|nr:hypothetical protein [Peribacillus cavernae]
MGKCPEKRILSREGDFFDLWEKNILSIYIMLVEIVFSMAGWYRPVRREMNGETLAKIFENRKRTFYYLYRRET